MSERVFVITSVYDNNALLPHFIHHYYMLGATTILISARIPEAHAVAERFEECYPVKSFCTPAAEFVDDEKRAVEDKILEDSGVQPLDWVIYADLDEFHGYPAPLRDIVRGLNRDGSQAIRGYMVDRLAGDGSLPKVVPDVPIWQQFPVMAHVTQMIAGAWTQKIVLTRYALKPAGGVNHTTVGNVFSPPPIGTEALYRIHHFKWIEGLYDKLAIRIREGRFSGVYYEECRRIIRYLDAHQAFDVTDPALRSTYSPYSPGR
jgi:hypothetical protein